MLVLVKCRPRLKQGHLTFVEILGLQKLLGVRHSEWWVKEGCEVGWSDGGVDAECSG